MTTHLTIKGQVTVPIQLRKMLGLNAGDAVHFVAEGSRVYLEKEPELSEIFGIVKARKSATLAEMDQALLRRHQRKPA